jgi:hypothetical protein
MCIDGEQQWLEEFDHFIFYWEQEAELSKEKQLSLSKCNEITDIFHKNSDGLLIKKPGHITEKEILTRLQQVNEKLNCVLAIACASGATALKKE